MLILGIIISLTLPIIKNIKDDDDIYRAYMKKATQDVTDAMNMIFVKVPNFTGFEMFQAAEGTYDADMVNSWFRNSDGDTNCTKLRNAFNKGLNTFECGICRDENDRTSCAKLIRKNAAGVDEEVMQCAAVSFNEIRMAGVPEMDDTQPGLILAGKPIMVFQYNYTADAADPENSVYGYVYVDMNKDKSPNELCKDRYRFIIYNDRVALDGCDFEL